ncbi:MAG: dTMP kinase [Clostridia bacterium]|nr:dTMP kinase [Clostridia bacterium]
MTKGRFIVLEGLDGSGKGTQADLLIAEMKRQGRKVCLTAEPTSSSTGGMLRDALGGFVSRDAYELSAMFLLDRIFHNVNPKNGIRQYIESGVDVVCDRYYYSSFAYQGIDADLKWVMDMNLNCREILKPDLCIFLDVSPEDGEKRISGSRLDREIYENTQAQKRIRNRFFEVFELLKDSENIKIVDASRTVPEVSADIIKLYNQLKEN